MLFAGNALAPGPRAKPSGNVKLCQSPVSAGGLRRETLKTIPQDDLFSDFKEGMKKGLRMAGE
jgi:hypothetical protein